MLSHNLYILSTLTFQTVSEVFAWILGILTFLFPVLAITALTLRDIKGTNKKKVIKTKKSRKEKIKSAFIWILYAIEVITFLSISAILLDSDDYNLQKVALYFEGGTMAPMLIYACVDLVQVIIETAKNNPTSNVNNKKTVPDESANNKKDKTSVLNILVIAAVCYFLILLPICIFVPEFLVAIDFFAVFIPAFSTTPLFISEFEIEKSRIAAEAAAETIVDNNATTTKNDTTATPQKQSQKRVSTVSLYEALRLPGDPDPELGEPTAFVTPDATDASDASEYFDNDENKDVNDIFSFLDFFDSPPKKKKKDYYEDYDDYSYDTHCEYCGELLEDCTCDHQDESRRDLGLWNGDDDANLFNRQSRGNNNNSFNDRHQSNNKTSSPKSSTSDKSEKNGRLDFDKFRTLR